MANPLNYKDFFDFDDNTPIDNAIKQIDALKLAYDSLIETSEKQSKGLVDDMDDIEKKAKELAGVVKKTNTTTEDGQKLTEEQIKSSQALVIQNDKLIKSQEDNEKATKELTEEVEKLEKSKKDLAKANKDESGSFNDLKKQLQQAEKDYKALGDSVDDSVRKEHLDRVSKLSKEFTQANDALKGAKKSAEFAAGSYNELNKQVLEGRKRLKQMEGGLEGNTEEFKALQKEVSENIVKLKAWDKELGDSFREVGNYEKATEGMIDKLESMPGAAGEAAGGVKGLGQQFMALLANPIVLLLSVIVGALTALFAAFKRTAGGADFLAKASGFLSGIISGLVGLFEKVAEVAVKAWEDPVQALKDFGQAILDNIVNRFTAILDLFKAVGKGLKALWDRDLDKLKDAASEAGTALIQMTTGFDEEQQKKMAEFGQSVLDTANAFALLAEQEREIIRLNRTREVQVLRLNKLHQEQLAIQEDDTRGFEERQKAALKASAALERKAVLELAIARSNLKIVNDEIDLRKANGENIEELLDRQLEANRTLIGAETELSTARLDNAEKRRRLTQDQLERDLDILIDGFDNQKTINERIIADDKRVLGERRKLFDETVKLSNISFQKQGETIQKFTDNQIDFNDLVATSDANILNEKIRALGLSEIIEGRLLEVVRERRMVEQDLSEAARDLNQEELDLSNRKIESDIKIREILGDRLILEKQIQDEILKETKLFAGKDRIKLLKDRLDIEFDLLSDRYQEELRLIEQSTVDEEEKNLKKKQAFEQFQSDLTNIQKQGAKDRQQIRQEEVNKVINAIKRGGQAAFDLFSSLADRQDVRRDEQLNKLNEQLEAELAATGNNAARQEEIQAEFAAKEDAIKAEQARSDRRRAIFEKSLAAFQIGIDTSRAIIKAVAASPLTGGLPWSAIVGALGAVQLAAVIAKPIPQFAKGVESSPEGIARINELGHELMLDRSGKAKIVNTDGPTYTYLQKGTKVFTAEETQRILTNNEFLESGKMYQNGVKITQEDNSRELARTMSRKLDEVKSTIERKKEFSLSFTRSGIDYLVKSGQNWTKFVDKNYS